MKTYTGNLNKRDVQRISLSSRYKTIFGLGGPNVREYVKTLKELGYKDIYLFENDYSIYEKQKRQKSDCDLVFDNILNHLGYKAFYDYDFCSSLAKVEQHMRQIVSTPSYSLTLSLRPLGYDRTISTFRKYTDAKYVSYYDTSAMITFFNH